MKYAAFPEYELIGVAGEGLETQDEFFEWIGGFEMKRCEVITMFKDTYIVENIL